MKEWVLLETYPSQSEARVVESFLRAQGVEVQLFDQHSAYNLLPPGPAGGAGGMRLMVADTELHRARRILSEARERSHLSLVDEETPGRPPPWLGRTDRIVIFLFIVLAGIVWAALRLAAARLNFDLHFRNQVHGHLFLNFAHLQFITTVGALRGSQSPVSSSIS